MTTPTGPSRVTVTVEVPEVRYPGPNHTTATHFVTAARNLRNGYPADGYVSEAIALLLERVATALDAPPAPAVPDLAEVSLAALAASGPGDRDGEVQRPKPALPMLRLEDAAGAILQVDVDPDGPHYVATIATEVFDEDGEQLVGAFGLRRAHATDLRDWLTRLIGDSPDEAVRQVLEVVRREWHDARRWQDPVPLSRWILALREILGAEAECCCEPCRTSDERAARAAEYQRLLVGSLRAQCEALGHVPADSFNCSRCGEVLSHADWSALVADEAASYTWVPTPTEQARINATLAHAGQHNTGDSPAEVLAFADELDAERDAAAEEGL